MRRQNGKEVESWPAKTLTVPSTNQNRRERGALTGCERRSYAEAKSTPPALQDVIRAWLPKVVTQAILRSAIGPH